MPTRDLSTAELAVIRLGEEWGHWRTHIYDARRMPLSDRAAGRFAMETAHLLTTIRRLRPDLNVIALAELANMDFRNPPSNGELHLLVQDCESLVGEFTHALITGIRGEYLACCPNAENLIKPGHGPAGEVPRIEPSGPDGEWVSGAKAKLLEGLGWHRTHLKKLDGLVGLGAIELEEAPRVGGRSLWRMRVLKPDLAYKKPPGG